MKGSYDKTLLSVQFLQVVKRPMWPVVCARSEYSYLRAPDTGKAYVRLAASIISSRYNFSFGLIFSEYAVNYTYGRYQLVGRRKYIHIPDMRGTSFMNDGAYSYHHYRLRERMICSFPFTFPNKLIRVAERIMEPQSGYGFLHERCSAVQNAKSWRVRFRPSGIITSIRLSDAYIRSPNCPSERGVPGV